MMCKEKRKVPKLRFPGFTEDWEQRKLGDLYKRVNERNDGSLGRDKWISVAKMYFQDPDKVQSNNLDTRTYVMKKGDIAFEGHPNNEFKFGRFVLNDIGTGIISELFPIYRPITEYDLDFWKYAIQLERVMAPIFAKSITSSGNSSNKLDHNHFLNQELLVPNIEEQKKIGTLLSILSKNITLHQRKLEHLNLKKKALLQKLFPKNGECYPELRFPGFTDAWEQRKLGELTISIGDGLHGTPKYDENGSYYFINGNNLVDSKVSVTEETKKVAFEALSNDDRRLDSTSILMSINGTIGTLARYNNENIMLGKSVAYITPKNINRDFLFYQLQGDVIQSYFYKNLTGTTIKNLGLGTIKNAIVMSTLSEEEFKIGQLFYKLDQYITLHQRKLDHLQLQKKALLQQMFV